MVFSVALGYIKHPAMTRIARQPLRSPRRGRPTPAPAAPTQDPRVDGYRGAQGALSRLLCHAGRVLGAWERPREVAAAPAPPACGPEGFSRCPAPARHARRGVIPALTARLAPQKGCSLWAQSSAWLLLRLQARRRAWFAAGRQGRGPQARPLARLWDFWKEAA